MSVSNPNTHVPKLIVVPGLDAADDAVDLLGFLHIDAEADKTAGTIAFRLAPAVADVAAEVEAGPAIDGQRRRRRRISRARVHVRGSGGSRRQHNQSGRSKEEFLHQKSPVFGSASRCPNVSPATIRTTPTPAPDSACACPFLAAPLEINCDPFATVVGKSDSRRHRGRIVAMLFYSATPLCPSDSALPFYLRSSSAKVLPKRAGDGETLMPAASMAAILLSASPLPPEMMAPAWPIRRPGGAVRPAMNPTIGFLRPRLASSARNWAASSSAEPPISPIITIASVALSAKNIASTSMNSVPFTGSPPIPTAVVWPSPTRVV